MNHSEPTSQHLPIDAPPRRTLTLCIARFAATAIAIAALSVPRTEARPGTPTRDGKIGNEASLEDSLVPDILEVSMAAGNWHYGSVPSRRSASPQPTSLLEIPGIHDAELHWYSPAGVVKERELNPTLTDAEGAQNYRPVLALSIPRRPESAASGDSLWVSLTYLFDRSGLDLTRAKYLEVWINDFRDPAIRDGEVRLHIDLGSVSEDQMRAPNQPPNGRLDTEDREPSDDLLARIEDTGLDGAGSAAEDGLLRPLDLATASTQDRGGDDYAPPSDLFAEIDPRRWLRTNGTEANGMAAPIPDTEDLNLNHYLDTYEGYFEYTIDLTGQGTPYLATDVSRDFPVVPPPTTRGFENGWRLYRIPIDNSNMIMVKHARVWIEGIVLPDASPDPALHVQRPLFMLGGMRVVFPSRPYVPPGGPSSVPAALASFPNPARADVTVDFALAREADSIELSVYDLAGRPVRVLKKETNAPAGRYRVVWDGRNDAGSRVPSGLYFISMRGPGLTPWNLMSGEYSPPSRSSVPNAVTIKVLRIE